MTSIFFLFCLISELRNQKEKLFGLSFDLNKKELIFFVGSLPLSLCISLHTYMHACMCMHMCKYTHFGLYCMILGGDSFITEKVCLILKQNGILN